MTNPIDTPGTPEDAWRDWPGLAQPPAGGLGHPGSLVVLAAHPDDEILGAGGVLSLPASAGSRLQLVAVTDGEAPHPGAGRHWHRGLSPIFTFELLFTTRCR